MALRATLGECIEAMHSFSMVLLAAVALSEAASLGALRLGQRLLDHPRLRRLGELSHARKRRALERTWPLTRIPPAVRRGDGATVGTIITALVLLKSVGSLVFGIVMVAWLPVASLIVPTIIAAEDPDDPKLRAWVEAVARLQVTSHVVAAALGFAITLAGPLTGRAASDVVRQHLGPTLAALALSAGFALAAGRREAREIVARGGWDPPGEEA